MNAVELYISEITKEKRESFIRLREVILENLPEGFEETMTYGMPAYVVPHSLYPKGYHVNPEIPLPYCSIAAQKNFIGFYHMGLYTMPTLQEWFVREYAKEARYKIDMGKSCVRLKRMDDIPFALIGRLMKKVSVKEWIKVYEKSLVSRGS